MSSTPLTDELVRRVADDLRRRYALDDDALRELGARLARGDVDPRSAANVAFAEQFVETHRATFDRLAE